MQPIGSGNGIGSERRFPPFAGPLREPYTFYSPPRSHRWWLHILLLLLTGLTTAVVGAGLSVSFEESRPVVVEDLYNYARVWNEPSYLLEGLPFSLTLLAILLAHELGHFLAARYYHVDASLPYFLPFPIALGTLGAFIRIRSVILSKRVLFDIGIAGPIAGFVVLLLPLVAGISLSKVIPGIATTGDMVYGTPLLMRLMQGLEFPGVPGSDIYLHPVARAAWVGLLATALNLMPIGQLDGGHILYAFLGNWTKHISRVLVVALVALGYVFSTPSWFVWAAIMLLFGMRHPQIVDPNPPGRARAWLAMAALVIFVISFTPSPIH